MEDTLLRISFEVQVVILMISLMIYLVVREDAAADLVLFLKTYLVEAAALDVHVEMIFYMNVILPWKMYYMENKLNLISKNL